MKIKNDTNMLTWIASFLCVEWCVHHSKMTLLDTSYLVGRVTMVSYHLKRQDNVFPRRHEQYTRHPTNGAGVVGRAGGKTPPGFHYDSVMQPYLRPVGVPVHSEAEEYIRGLPGRRTRRRMRNASSQKTTRRLLQSVELKREYGFK